MAIIKHGGWTLYTPAALPAGAPPSALFCRRETDNTDWYDYVNSGVFAVSSVVFATRNSDMVVGPATYDATAIFPVKQQIFEIQNYQGADPQTDLGGKVYDPATETFTDQPPDVLDIKTLQDRIAALEAKAGGA